MARQQEGLPSSAVTPESQAEMGAATALAGTDVESARSVRVSSPSRNAWRRFRRNWAAMLSLAIILILIVMAAFAPFMHTASPLAQDFNALDAGPTAQHWLGTDSTGRDEYSRLVFALRIPLIVGLLGTAVTVILGTFLGVVSGYFGGFADDLLSRFTDLMFAFPAFTLALVVVSLFGPSLDPYFGGGGRVILLTLVFALVSWPPLMRFVRSLALSMKEQQYVEAARTVGTGQWGVMRRHLLPNMWGLILVQASFIVVAVISTETILSIFGLGVEQPNPDIGAMLYDGVQRIALNGWEVLAPSIVLAVLIVAFTFLADGIRDAVDPRARG